MFYRGFNKLKHALYLDCLTSGRDGLLFSENLLNKFVFVNLFDLWEYCNFIEWLNGNTFTFFRRRIKNICVYISCFVNVLKRFFLDMQFFSCWPNREQLCFQSSKSKLCIISWTKRCCRIVSTYIRGRINYIAKKLKIYTDVIYRESHLKVLIIFTQSESLRKGWLQILVKGSLVDWLW